MRRRHLGYAILFLATLVCAAPLAAQAAVGHSGGTLRDTAPANTAPPTVSGTPKQGQTLTTTTGTWSGTTPMTYAYQWLRCATSNVISNGGFETDGSGWSGLNGGVLSPSTAQAHSGTGSLKIVEAGNASAQGAQYIAGAGAIVPAHSYRFVVWVYATTAATVNLTMRFYNASGAELNGGIIPFVTSLGWNRLAIRVTSPAGAATAAAQITVNRVSTTLYADDATLTDCLPLTATRSTYAVQAADAGSTLASVVTATNGGGSVTFMSALTAMALDQFDTAPAYTGPTYASNNDAYAGDPVAPPPIQTSLPTWRNLYDWQNGHGYAGWHYATSATDARYGSDTNHGGQPGLWLWPAGDQQYTPNQAEWTYTAPGTTRISTVNLTFAYRNKFLAHHCLVVGLRTLDGTTIQEDRWCKPALPPDSQRDVSVRLADPKNNPTAKVLYFRVEFPACADPSSPSCSKYIPQLDPLTTGAYARLKLADMILVDDDNPTLTPAGSLYDIRDTYIAGAQTYDVTVHADEAGAGIQKAWLERQGFQAPTGILSSRDAGCDPAHYTPALDARLCPPIFEYQTSVDSNLLAEGTSHFFEKAQDVAGNVGPSVEWKFYVDRTPPAVPTDIHLASFDAAAGVASIAWDASSDPMLPDGVSGSGTDRYRYRYQKDGADWTAWIDSLTPSFGVEVAGGDVLNLEVTVLDAVGNESSVGAASITIPTQDDSGDFTNPPGSVLTQPFPDPTLTSAQVAQAISATETSSAFSTLVGNRSYSVTATEPWGPDAGPGLSGAVVSVTFDQPAVIDGDWPQIIDNGDGTTRPDTEHFFLANVRTIDSYVDLGSDSVAALDPNPDAVWANSPFVGAAVADVLHAQRPYSSVRAVNTTLQTQTEAADDSDVDTGRATNALHLVCTADQNCWMNFDFTTNAKTEGPTWNNVDWPVTVLWTGQSNINKVKAYVEYELAWYTHGGSMAAVVQQAASGAGRVWDEDKGKKESLCTWHFKTPHMRLYADPDTDFLFSLSYGNYVLGTTHFDWAECSDYAAKIWYWPHPSPHLSGAGYSEAVEQLLVSELRSALAAYPPYARTTIQPESLWLANAEHFTHGSHHADNNGLATIIRLG